MTVIPHINSNVPANPDLHRDESGLNLASMDKDVDEIIGESSKSCEELYVSFSPYLVCSHEWFGWNEASHFVFELLANAIAMLQFSIC